jgi:hypothetical protein
MTEITYHAAACALAGLPTRVSPERLKVLTERQRQLGIRLPEAVVEWYALDGAVEFQAAVTVAVAAAGVLLIVNENQDCCTLVVPLDEGPNPQVQLMDPFDLELEEAVALREPFAASFSDFVRARLWDAEVQRAPRRRTSEGVPFSTETLAALRATATEEAPTTGLPGDDGATYRLGFAHGRLAATVHQGEAFVRAGADTGDGLDALLGMFPTTARQ